MDKFLVDNLKYLLKKKGCCKHMKRYTCCEDSCALHGYYKDEDNQLSCVPTDLYDCSYKVRCASRIKLAKKLLKEIGEDDLTFMFKRM